MKQTDKKKSPMIDFSSTVWFGARTEMLAEHLTEHLSATLGRYPERDAATLRKMIARRHDLTDEEIIVTNGPTGALYQIAQGLNPGKLLLTVPSPPEYKEAFELYGYEIVYVSDLEPIANWPLDKVDYCLLSTPNNPDGHIVSHSELVGAIKRFPHVKFVIDQSYATFTTTNMLSSKDIKLYPNLILVWSFSQSYGIPGLRIGYMVADKPIANQIARYTIPWSVTSIAQEAAKYILIHPAQFALPIRKWLRNAQELMSHLRTFDALEVINNETTFFLVKVKVGTAEELRLFLEENYNMTIAVMNDYYGLDETYMRISALSEEHNQMLVEAIGEWLDTKNV